MLDCKTLKLISRVNKHFNKISYDKGLWKNGVEKEYDKRYIDNFNYYDIIDNVWKRLIICDSKTIIIDNLIFEY